MMNKLIPIILAFAVSGTVLGKELSAFTASKLQQAQQLESNGKLTQAIRLLEPLKSKRSYDQALVDRSLGVYYWKNNQLNKAVTSLESALNTNALEGEQRTQLKRMLADVLFNQKEYRRAILHYSQLTKTAQEPMRSELWMSMAKAHYQLEEWQQTLRSVNRVQRAPKKMVELLTLKLGAQVQLAQWKHAKVTLRTLLKHQPKQVEWWRQLVSVELRDKDVRGALASLALAKKQITLSVQDRKLLARLFYQAGVPERAALELADIPHSDSELELIVEQATYWQHAKEWKKATQFWSKAAAKQPKYHWQLALVLSQNGEHQQVLDVLKHYKAQRAEVSLLKAQMHDKLNQLDKALSAAKEAQRIEPSQKTESWVTYLSDKRALAKQLDQQASGNKEGSATSTL